MCRGRGTRRPTKFDFQCVSSLFLDGSAFRLQVLLERLILLFLRCLMGYLGDARRIYHTAGQLRQDTIRRMLND